MLVTLPPLLLLLLLPLRTGAEGNCRLLLLLLFVLVLGAPGNEADTGAGWVAAVAVLVLLLWGWEKDPARERVRDAAMGRASRRSSGTSVWLVRTL